MGSQLNSGSYAHLAFFDLKSQSNPMTPANKSVHHTRRRPRKPVHARASRTGSIVQSIVSVLSGEWILNWTPYTANGGTVVATRAAWLTFWIFGAAFLLKTSLAEGKTLDFDLRQGAADFAEIIPWLGAVFAGVYVALYTRFASQWNYLAALYNQIVEAQLAMPSDNVDDRQSALAAWKAGLHNLAVKLTGTRCGREGAGSSSYRSSVVKVLAGPAAYLCELCRHGNALATTLRD
jgi:hypothetical protein